jgi:uncharacterized protein
VNLRALIDSNLIIRHLVQDHPQHGHAASKLFEACDRGTLRLVLLQAVLGECVFVLESFYKHPRTEIARVLAQLISSPGIELDDREILLDALERYGRTKIHFVDCTLAAYAAGRNWPVASFDADFKRFADIRILKSLTDPG